MMIYLLKKLSINIVLRIIFIIRDKIIEYLGKKILSIKL